MEEDDIVKFKNSHLGQNIPIVPKSASRVKRKKIAFTKRARSTQPKMNRNKDFADYLYQK